MTIKDAIQGMMNFYRAVEKVYADLPEEVEVANEVKEQFDNCFIEASDAMDELEKMQTLGINREHCKYNDSGANACKECSFYPYWLVPIDQKRPLNYEPI